jgi:predicted porin
VGGDYAGLSVDGYYAFVSDAVATAALSAAQVAELPTLGFSPSNALAGTISDNTTYAIMAMYNFGAPKIYAGYEHIEFANPKTPLAAGFDDIGGYKIAFVNAQSGADATFATHKQVQIFWGGVKYTVLSKLDLTGAYYGYRQNSYATGANTGCSTNKAGNCSGQEDVVSASADWRFSKRFDAYVGAMWSEVENGLDNGFLSKNTIDPTIGVRFRW